jgi:cytoskeletal protein CcmA (bactofilin family)
VPGKRQSDIVDGFTVFKAAARAADAGRDRKKQSPTAAGSAPGPTGRPVASHIGRTAMPTRHDLLCFECGYHFQIAGRIPSTICPKCKSEIPIRDVTISDAWNDVVKTGGNVTVEEGGCVKGGTVIAKDIVLRGRVEGGTLESRGRLILCRGCGFDPGCLSFDHLEIEEGASIRWKGAARFASCTIRGSLKAQLHCSERIAVAAGGLLEGRAEAPSLTVEDGGGLKGPCAILPTEPPKEEISHE